VLSQRSLHARGLVLLAALGTASTARSSESSIDCAGGIVEVGDTKVELLGKCGEPTLRDARSSVRGTLIVATVEEWTYNFGPSRFLMRVTLEGGKVVLIERGGHGYDPDQLRPVRPGGPARCESSAIHVGDAKIDLLARCGEPATRDVRLEQRELLAENGSGGAPGLRTVQVEVWIYDFGPQRFMTIVTLENGEVTRLERGGYGFAR
jgi:hypothetical protein